MESCGGRNYWARKFRDMGHEVKVMNAKYVKPYVKTNKNDANDSEGICEAVTRPYDARCADKEHRAARYSVHT
jgi:transposase